jgi:predicted nucleic acid-binding protein
LNRPFDDLGQRRVREESEAIVRIVERVVAGEWTHLSSDVVTLELEAMPDEVRRAQVEVLLSSVQSIIRLTMPVFRRSAELRRYGLKVEDSLHVAAAEAGGADVM